MRFWVLWSGVGLIFLAGLAVFVWRDVTIPVSSVYVPEDQTQSGQISGMAGVPIGGAFELVDHTGDLVRAEDFADGFKLIYFGFTYCPAICPTELQKMVDVLDRLGEDAKRIHPLFVTVDPERDTPDVMKTYVEMFHPRLRGLTGSRAQIDSMLQTYRIYASRIDDPALSDYTMDHSTFIYLMSPDDRLVSIYKMEDNAEHIAGDIRRRLSQKE